MRIFKKIAFILVATVFVVGIIEGIHSFQKKSQQLEQRYVYDGDFPIFVWVHGIGLSSEFNRIAIYDAGYAVVCRYCESTSIGVKQKKVALTAQELNTIKKVIYDPYFIPLDRTFVQGWGPRLSNVVLAPDQTCSYTQVFKGIVYKRNVECLALNDEMKALLYSFFERTPE